MPREPADDGRPDAVHNEFRGSAGVSVQAQQISGGVHVHGVRRPGIWLAIALAVVLVGATGVWVWNTMPNPDPLSIQVADKPECNGAGGWVFPEDFSLANLPPRQELNNKRAYELGAATESDSRFEITVHGRSPESAVVLQDLRVRVLSREPAPTEGIRVRTCQGEGNLRPRYFAIDLDNPQPRPIPVAEDVFEPGDQEGIPPRKTLIRVTPTDPEVFIVHAKTQHCACRWQLELDWVSPEGSGTEVINLDGQPFRTTAVKDGLDVHDHSAWGDD